MTLPRRLLPLFLLFAGSALAGERAILVLDASGSMWQQVDGRSKVEIARNAVDALLADWNPEVSLGLMAYGHRRRGDCEDIELLIPPDGFERARISDRVRGLNALGMTPITASVRRAAEALRDGEHRATVILISDGEETCNADPCALGRELAAQGIDFTAHVIGFDLPEGPARDQLQCLARETGGLYLEARDAAELNRAVGELVAAAPAEPPAPAPVAEGDGLQGTLAFMPCVDLYESDYDSFDLAPGEDARTCQARCLADERCDAWTYTVPGWQAEHGKCWLKSGSPWQRNCDDCTSGARPGVRVFIDEDFVPPFGRPECALPKAAR